MWCQIMLLHSCMYAYNHTRSRTTPSPLLRVCTETKLRATEVSNSAVSPIPSRVPTQKKNATSTCCTCRPEKNMKSYAANFDETTRPPPPRNHPHLKHQLCSCLRTAEARTKIHIRTKKWSARGGAYSKRGRWLNLSPRSRRGVRARVHSVDIPHHPTHNRSTLGCKNENNKNHNTASLFKGKQAK